VPRSPACLHASCGRCVQRQPQLSLLPSRTYGKVGPSGTEGKQGVPSVYNYEVGGDWAEVRCRLPDSTSLGTANSLNSGTWDWEFARCADSHRHCTRTQEYTDAKPPRGST